MKGCYWVGVHSFTGLYTFFLCARFKILVGFWLLLFFQCSLVPHFTQINCQGDWYCGSFTLATVTARNMWRAVKIHSPFFVSLNDVLFSLCLRKTVVAAGWNGNQQSNCDPVKLVNKMVQRLPDEKFFHVAPSLKKQMGLMPGVCCCLSCNLHRASGNLTQETFSPAWCPDLLASFVEISTRVCKFVIRKNKSLQIFRKWQEVLLTSPH